MKTKLSSLLAVAALALAPALYADTKPQPADQKTATPACCERCKDGCKCEAGKCACEENKKDTPKKDGRVVLTGSRIPQKVTQVGMITNGMHPVTVITASDLNRTGATNVGDALRLLVPALH